MRLDPTTAPEPHCSDPVLAGRIKRLALAIAQAENSPPDWNNPCDISDTFGFPNRGPMNPEDVTGFNSLTNGWLAAYHKFWLALTGKSAIYKPTMTIAEMAVPYAGKDQAAVWAKNVAEFLGVPVDTPIAEV